MNWKPWQKPEKNVELIKTLNYLPHNWSLTPLWGKKPFRKNWQTEEQLPQQHIIKLITEGETKICKNGSPWRSHCSGYGLRTGNASGGLLAIDFDGKSSLEVFQAILGSSIEIETVCWTSGKPGRFQLLFQVPEKNISSFHQFTRLIVRNHQNIFCVPGEMLEFRYNKCQSALPPSNHPETGNYRWISSPWKTPVAFLPESIIKFLQEKQQRVKQLHQYQYKTKQLYCNEDKVVSALFSINPDCPYDEWIKVGMALKSESDLYLDLWEAWSSKGSKYKPNECERKWRSFQNLKVSIGSLFYLSKLHS